MKKQGFSSLFVIIILASLVFFILAVVEVTAGFSSRSTAENICVITGESILSEYQKDLFELYGLLALQSFDEKLSRMAAFYIEESLHSEGANILKMQLKACNVSSEKYPALDVNAFSSQIQALSLALIGKDVLSGLDFSDVMPEIKSAADSAHSIIEDSEEEMQTISEASSTYYSNQEEEESIEEKKAGKQVKNLWNRYKDVTEMRNSSEFEFKAIDDIDVRRSLPSNLLGISPRRNILSACIDLDVYPDSWIENEYILNRCSYATAIQENAYIDLEAEYILYGRFSDQENEEEIRSSLFWLRSALNLAHIYSDSHKRAEVTALASGTFALVPFPVAVCIISGIWAAIEAHNDLNLLFDGQCVPFIKNAKDWKSSLSGAVGGHVSLLSSSGSSSAVGTYEDYVRLFLLAIPKCEKLARLMDIIQLNIANKGKHNFCFQDYAYGFSLTASFEKSMHLPGDRFVSERTGSVVQEHVY